MYRVFNWVLIFVSEKNTTNNKRKRGTFYCHYQEQHPSDLLALESRDTLFHVKWTTSNFNRSHLGRILPYVIWAIFTLYRTVKRCVAECALARAFVHIKDATFGTFSAPEQDYFAPHVKDVIPATQRCTCSCSHCIGSVSATLLFAIRCSRNLALSIPNCHAFVHIIIQFTKSMGLIA